MRGKSQEDSNAKRFEFTDDRSVADGILFFVDGCHVLLVLYME